MKDCKRYPIQVKNLVKSFADLKRVGIYNLLRNHVSHVKVLDGLDFEVGKGEILGVMGRNGAGKSTLLRLLGDIYLPDSGIITIKGEIASIFEMGTFIDSKETGRQYCKTFFDFYEVPKDEANTLIEAIYEFTELGEFFDKQVITYSSGMKAKLLFGVATAIQSDVILIDEVLVVGDEYFQGRAWRRLTELVHSGSAGVIVSHDWVSILRLCSKCMLLKDGKIDYIGPSDQAVQRYLGAHPVHSKEITIKNKNELANTQLFYEHGEDFEFSFDVQINTPPKDQNIFVVFTIERYKIGEGWRLVTTFEKNIVITQKGLLSIKIKISKLELAAGEYNLSIVTALPPNDFSQMVPKIFEEMSWLSGAPIKFTVKGNNPKQALLKRQQKWTINYL